MLKDTSHFLEIFLISKVTLIVLTLFNNSKNK